jgi:hypothetical protein
MVLLGFFAFGILLKVTIEQIKSPVHLIMIELFGAFLEREPSSMRPAVTFHVC